MIPSVNNAEKWLLFEIFHFSLPSILYLLKNLYFNAIFISQIALYSLEHLAKIKGLNPLQNNVNSYNMTKCLCLVNYFYDIIFNKITHDNLAHPQPLLHYNLWCYMITRLTNN